MSHADFLSRPLTSSGRVPARVALPVPNRTGAVAASRAWHQQRVSAETERLRSPASAELAQALRRQD